MTKAIFTWLLFLPISGVSFLYDTYRDFLNDETLSSKYLGEERVFLTYASYYCSSLKESGRELKQDRVLEAEANDETTERDLLLLACSACFPEDLRTTNPGMIPLTMFLVLLHQPLIRRIPFRLVYSLILWIDRNDKMLCAKNK